MGWLQLLRRLTTGSAVALACLVATGCFAPSDPAGPPVGVRIEQGLVVLYLPLCPGEKLVSGQIDEPVGNGRTLWRGEQPAHPEGKVVRLGSPDWGQQTGGFSYHGQTFSFDVEGTARIYGGGADRWRIPVDLPPDTYELDRKKVTAAEIDQKSDCQKSG